MPPTTAQVLGSRCWTFMAVPGHEQAMDAVVIAQAYGMTASTAFLTGAGRVDWRMKKGSSLPVQSSARRHLMTSEPVRDPFADHLLTPQNCALIIIGYQPGQVSSIRSMDQEGPAGRLPEQRHRLGGPQPARHWPAPVRSGRRGDRG
jgi:hypothetical protein